MAIRAVDFFCGCGGTSAGFKAAGIQVACGLDNDEDAAASFKLNFPDASFILDGIERVRPKDLYGTIERTRDYPLLFSACAPCQPFSKQNQGRVKKITKGHKASLLDELHPFINHYLPDYFFLENVPGMQKISTRTGPFARFLALLNKRKYSVATKVVHSQDYGVPQRRQRLVLLATRLGDIEIPSPTHGPNTRNKQYSNVRKWIGHLPPIASGEEHPTIKHHRARSLSDLNLQRIRATPEGGDRRDWPKKLLLDCHLTHDGHSDVYGRLSKDKPASALTTKCITLSNGRFGHPIQDRALSIREAACLQTFPRGFRFHGNLAAMSRQIGNAVPVLMAKVFGKAIVRHYQSYCKAEA